MRAIVAFALTLLALVACKEEVTALPEPVAMTEEAVSYYCQMSVLEHGGPKAQIHLEGLDAPLFFAQVRDAVAHLKSPERDRRVLVTYVSDMGQATDWDELGIEYWTDAAAASFVIEADVAGGMGAPEVVPFADRAAADDFAARHGGRVVALEDIPDAEIFGPIDPDQVLQDPII